MSHVYMGNPVISDSHDANISGAKQSQCAGFIVENPLSCC